MNLSTAYNRRDAWYYGIVISRVDRINDVPNYLVGLGVDYLIPYLLVNERMNAFIYGANLVRRKHSTLIVEFYHDTRPRATEWREKHAEIALWLDEDLVEGLDYDVVVTDFVIPFGRTAHEEAGLIT